MSAPTEASPFGSAQPVNVVVGAGSGIGAAVAARLAVRGGPLVVADRDRAAVDRLAQELGGDLRVESCDVTDVEQIGGLAASIDRLGALVVTAGISSKMGDGGLILEVNLRGVARLIDAFEAHAGADAVAVCIASVAGHLVGDSSPVGAVLDDPFAPDFFQRLERLGIDPDDPATGYGLSKLGLIRFVRRRARAWGIRGARILSVSPGVIDTPMVNRQRQREPRIVDLVHSSAFGRVGTVDEVASVIDFLTSSHASFMTGCDVLVDGGTIALTSASGAEG